MLYILFFFPFTETLTRFGFSHASQITNSTPYSLSKEVGWSLNDASIVIRAIIGELQALSDVDVSLSESQKNSQSKLVTDSTVTAPPVSSSGLAASSQSRLQVLNNMRSGLSNSSQSDINNLKSFHQLPNNVISAAITTSSQKIGLYSRQCSGSSGKPCPHPNCKVCIDLAKKISLQNVKPEVIGVTAMEMLNQIQQETPLFTLSKALDQLLSGGFQLGVVSEILGLPGTGKTQLSMQLAVNATVPVAVGGWDTSVIYIDTEGCFTPERALEIAAGLEAVLKVCFLSYIVFSLALFNFKIQT